MARLDKKLPTSLSPDQDQFQGTHRKRGDYGAHNAAGGLLHDVPGSAIESREYGVLFQDFISADDVTQYVVTNITSGTAVTDANSVNGAMQLTATTANQGLGSVQFDDGAVDNAAAFVTAAAGRIVACEAAITINDVSDCDWFFGVGEVDTTFMSNAGALLANGGDNHVGFHHLIADAGVVFASSAGVAVANVERTAINAGNGTTRTMSDATQTRLGFRIVGTDELEFYVDGVRVHSRTMANALAEPLTPTFTMIANGSAITMDVDYLLVAQTR